MLGLYTPAELEHETPAAITRRTRGSQAVKPLHGAPFRPETIVPTDLPTSGLTPLKMETPMGTSDATFALPSTRAEATR